MGEKKQYKPTQCDQIIDYIKRYGSITSWQAYADLGITQLAARIFNLKERGYEFETERVNTKNRMGEATHYDIYRLKGAN
jgi:hypothetical protein